MLIHCIKAENLKLKHSCIWLACLIIPCIPAVMGVFNYLQNLELLKSGWYSLWSQLSLFYASFFYAPLIGLYCSYIWRLEHLNNNWNVLMTTPVTVPCVFFGKTCSHFENHADYPAMAVYIVLYMRQILRTPRLDSPGNHSLASARNTCRNRDRSPSAPAFHADSKFLTSNWNRPGWQFSGSAH